MSKLIDRLLVAITDRLPCRIINDGNVAYLERYYVGTLLGWRTISRTFPTLAI